MSTIWCFVVVSALMNFSIISQANVITPREPFTGLQGDEGNLFSLFDQSDLASEEKDTYDPIESQLIAFLTGPDADLVADDDEDESALDGLHPSDLELPQQSNDIGIQERSDSTRRLTHEISKIMDKIATKRLEKVLSDRHLNKSSRAACINGLIRYGVESDRDIFLAQHLCSKHAKTL